MSYEIDGTSQVNLIVPKVEVALWLCAHVKENGVPHVPKKMMSTIGVIWRNMELINSHEELWTSIGESS